MFKRPGGWRIALILSATSLLVIHFTNCGQFRTDSGKPAHKQELENNGQGFDGKTFANLLQNGLCADGSNINAKIQFDESGDPYLVRDNCADIAPQSLNINDITFQDSSTIYYLNSLFEEFVEPVAVPCTAGKQVFIFTGANQNVTVPAGCTQMKVKAWGAGGGYGGGGGGFATGTYSVSANDAFTVTVGGGGKGALDSTTAAPNSGGFAGGGPAGARPAGLSYAGAGAGGGGGRSSVIRTDNIDFITAGGGGGGPAGGAGGGLSGLTPITPAGDECGSGVPGSGGGPASGGAAGNDAGRICNLSILSPAGAGSMYNGGAGIVAGYSYGQLFAGIGGGGGGGYYGGGGGGTWRAGGGGSSYIGNGLNASTVAGANSTPGNAGDPERNGAGNGGANAGTDGSNGLVIIEWLP